jgi:hypothetical protein
MQGPRFKATYRGQVIGWYDTADEAQAAIDKREEADARADAELGEWDTSPCMLDPDK